MLKFSFLSAIVVTSTLNLCSCISLFAPKFVQEEIRQSELYVKNHPDSFSTIKNQDRDQYYTQIGNKLAPKIIFVHGSPGGWGAYVQLLNSEKLQAEAHLISVDRLGYGGSRRGGVSRSLSEQAQAIMQIVNAEDPQQPVILVGHSYGGPVVAKIAGLGDPRIKSVLILAGSVDPSLEDTKWYQIPADWFIFSWIIPNDLLTCNREILALKTELETLNSDWARMNTRLTVVQGSEDSLVDPRNADFIEDKAKHLKPKILRLAGQDHFLQINQNDLIEKILLEELKLLK